MCAAVRSKGLLWLLAPVILLGACSGGSTVEEAVPPPPAVETGEAVADASPPGDPALAPQVVGGEGEPATAPPFPAAEERPVPRPPTLAPEVPLDQDHEPRVHPRPETEGASPVSPEGVVPSEEAVDSPSVPDHLVTVPAGTNLEIKLRTALSTRSTEAGETFEADIKGALWIEDRKVPLGRWTLLGRVALVARPERKDDRPGSLDLSFYAVRTDQDEEYPLEAVATEFAGDTRERNVGMVVGGALLGAVVGKKSGGEADDAALGAAAGALAGAGLVRALPGKHLDLPAGTELGITLTGDAYLPFVAP